MPISSTDSRRRPAVSASASSPRPSITRRQASFRARAPSATRSPPSRMSAARRSSIFPQSGKRAACSVISPTSRGGSIRGSSTSGRWRPLPPRARWMSLGATGPRLTPMSTASSPPDLAHSRRAPTAKTTSSPAARASRRPSTSGPPIPGSRPTAWGASSRPSAFFSPVIRSTTIRTCCKRWARRPGPNSQPRPRRGG